MQFHQHRLPNGLQIIGETSPAARSVALGFFVRTGSRDESLANWGVSHFLEHMVFKGTPRRSAFDVNRDFDRIGANYNAFTSEESTVFYAAVLPEYLDAAVDILADILRPSLRAEDFETEKKVILEEIGMYDDQPNWAVFDRAKQFYFQDHPLGRSVLGTSQSVTALTQEQMLEYHGQRYQASNILAVAAGNFDWETFVDLVAKRCAAWPTGPIAPRAGRLPPCPRTLEVVARESVMQEHVVLMSPGPSIENPLHYPAEVLSMILGDDSGSRLYWALIDPGRADGADTSCHVYEGAGAFYTAYSCDAENAAENYDIVRAILSQTQREGVTAEELQQAKSKIGSRIVRAAERPMGRMNAIGMHWLYLNEYREIDQDLQAYDSVSLERIREVLEQFPLDEPTTLAYGPLNQLAPVS